MSEPLRNILFEIETILATPDEDLTDEQKEAFDQYLDELAEAESEKIDACVAWMKEQNAKADFYKNEARLFQRKAKSLENAVQRLKDNYLRLFDEHGVNNRIAGNKYTLSVRVTPVVTVDVESDIPSEWWREKVERSVDKDGIKKALKAGTVIPGVHLGESRSLQMK